MDNVTCPFCGSTLNVNAVCEARHPVAKCPMSNINLCVSDWRMRPPQKETALPSEIEYLRGLVRDLVDKKPEVVTQYIYPEHT